MTNNFTDTIIMEARGISKSFPGVLALDKVDLKIYSGKVNAIVGENGAGKSTLMNILSGVYADYEGEILLNGETVNFKNTTDAKNAGISIIHQELQLIPYLSIAENIFLGRESLTNTNILDIKKMRSNAEDLLEKLEFTKDVRTKVSSLRVGQQQIVEIAKALSFDVRVLIMDEPTSALSESEINILFKLIKALTARGVAIVYITHKMDELTKLADYVTVFRDGCSVGESTVDNITVDEIIKLMVGRDIKEFFVKKEHIKGNVKLKVEKLSLKKKEIRENIYLRIFPLMSEVRKYSVFLA